MITINLHAFLSIAGAAFGLASLLAACLMLRANARLRANCVTLESRMAALSREMELVASISVRTGRQVKRIEHEYSGVAERVEQVEQRGPAQAFDQAIDSARRGEDPGKLAQLFGLSRGEAELVTRLHGRKKRA